MILLGWDLQQWAIAIGRYGIDEHNIKGAVRLKRIWQEHNTTDPGEVRIAGVKLPKDYDAVDKLLNNTSSMWAA